MSIHSINKNYEYGTGKFMPWYIQVGSNVREYGISAVDFDNYVCNITFVNETGNKIHFDNISYYEASNSLIVFAYDKVKQKYYELLNSTSKKEPLNISMLEDMILIVETIEGLYVIHKNNTNFYSKREFFKLSNDGKSIEVKKHTIKLPNRMICYEDYPVDGNGIVINKCDPVEYKSLEEKYDIVYSVDRRLSSQIAARYFEKYNPVLLENIFDDDNSANYKISVSFTDNYELGEFDFFIHKVSNYSIYGISVNTLLNAVLNNCNFQDSRFESDEDREKYQECCISIFDKLKQKYKLNDNDMAQYLYDYYIKSHDISINSINYHVNKNNITYEKYGKDWKNKYKNIHMKLINEGILNVKWKSEMQLYMIIKSLYEDAIYQYRDKWLGYQSLDVYIPSLKIAFEYQGKQHYAPVNIFGGEEHFHKQQQLDQRKRNLCLKENIRLIEWKYNQPLVKIDVQEKIEKVKKEIKK